MSADRETPDDVTPDSSAPMDATQPLGTTGPSDARSDDTQQKLTLEDLMDTDRADTASATSSPNDTGTRVSGTTPASGPLPPVAEVAPRRGVRVGTVVWGLVIAAVGVGLLAYASGVVFDVQLALIILIAAAGLALLTGSLMSGMRRRGR